MPIPLFQIDAFTASPFAGNPAGVCLLEKPADPAWMQAVAAEMNLSETAFIYHVSDGWNLRWFTPTTEVKLCGHATLASAHALWQAERLAKSEPARFHTVSGLLTCARQGEWIEMDFPADFSTPADIPTELAAALGVSPVASSKVSGAFGNTWLLELADEAAVRGLAPDFRAMIAAPHGSVIATSRARTAGFDFVSRCFFPCEGIDEDPVTGSAHCSLGPYWADKLGKRDLIALQASARSGVVKVAVGEPADRVKISGQAVTVFRAELLA